jgi:c-di-GMP-binding flagellar brake protein YcgR
MRMTSAQPAYERRYSRVQLPVAAEVSCEMLNRFHEPAHLRDISAGGAFLYADLEIQPGTAIRIDFAVPVAGTQVLVSSEGSVVRLEQRAMGDKSGIAVQFASLNLSS